jgi:glyoxylase-like metal-dependent hydrolase (beta-lactamase superfamily II)
MTVNEWWTPGSTIDLGGRILRVLSTPGHTHSSAAVYDADRRQLFAGDFIYPGTLYAFLPDASRTEYLATSRKLIATLDRHPHIRRAHGGRSSRVSAPVLRSDLRWRRRPNRHRRAQVQGPKFAIYPVRVR